MAGQRTRVPLTVIGPGGDLVLGATVQLKHRNADGSAGANATHYSAEEAGSSSTGPVNTDAKGQVTRYHPPGRYIASVSAPDPNPLNLVGGDEPYDVPLSADNTMEAASDWGFATRVAGDANPRCVVQADGKIVLGGGSATADLEVSRFGSGALRVKRPSGGATILNLDADTGQVSRLSLAENGTDKWLVNRTTGGHLTFVDVPTSNRVVMELTDDGQVLINRTPSNYTLGALHLGNSAAADGTGGQDPIRLLMNSTGGFTNGTNGVRGDDPRSTGTALGVGASFFYYVNGQHTFNTKGGIVPFWTQVTMTTPVGSSVASFDNYQEVSVYGSVVHMKNRGAYGAGFEANVFGYSDATNIAAGGVPGQAGPSKLKGIRIGIAEDNAFSTHNDADVHGAASLHRSAGAVGINIDSTGTQEAGTGMLFYGSAGYKRLIVGRNPTTSFDFYCVDGTGNIGVRATTGHSSTLAAALTIGYTSAGAASTSTADGINFGGHSNFFSPTANVLKVDQGFHVGSTFRHLGTQVGFCGVTPVSRQTLGAAATDAATTQTLANNIRTAMINFGLGQT